MQAKTTVDSTTPTVYTTTIIDKERAMTEMSNLQRSHLIQRCCSEHWTEVDGIRASAVTIPKISFAALCCLTRVIAVFINVRLACYYYWEGQSNYCVWTMAWILIPLFITTLMQANMCHEDGKLNEGTCKALQTLLYVSVASFLFRDLQTLIYCIRCKIAEKRGHEQSQSKYFKLTVREESDVAFIRLFECFLEAAPQKILQISIVLGQVDKMTGLQTIAICWYFGNMALCLAVYQASSRRAQVDKYNIKKRGFILLLCWHFCISVSRTLCIAFVASVCPLWTVVGCLCHVLLLGITIFIVDRPKFTATSMLNFLFCLVLGIVYLFTFISASDAPTRPKYTLYYAICFIENLACVIVFGLFASSNLVSLAFLFYPLCVMAIAFYWIGIVFMIIYYNYFHPKITARQSKRVVNNN